MRSLATITTALTLVATFTTAAFAQEATDARVTAMGGVRAGLANGASAFLDNPAGLPDVDTFGTRLSPWPIMVSGSTTLDADVDVWSILGSARNSARTQGIGAGIWHADADAWDADFIGAGYGLELLGPDTSLGISVYQRDRSASAGPAQDGDGDATVFSVGLMKRFEGRINNWRLGAVVRDITDELDGPTVDVGASIELPAGWLVAADLVDLTDEVDTRFNAGAQWRVPMTSWALRAGLADGDLTVGLGYRISNFELSGAWADFEGGDEFQVSATGCF